MRWCLRSAATLVAALFTLVSTMPALAWGQDRGTHYVALGDSYSAGVGTSDVIPASGACHRSRQAYPAAWARHHQTASFVFAACASATTDTLTAGQLAALDAATSLVTVTIGGNDVDAAGMLQHCLLGTDAQCGQAVAAGAHRARQQLAGTLDATYQHIAAAAPHARVLVLGYPHLISPALCPLPGLTPAKRHQLNHGIDALDTVLAHHAQTAGFGYVDVRQRFAGHGVCSNHPWIHGPTLPPGNSFHPTNAGHQAGYLPALTAVTSSE